MIGKNQKLKVSFEVDGDGNVVRAFTNITQASDRSAKSLDNTGNAAETSAAKHKRLTAAARQAGDVLGKALAGGALLAVGALTAATNAVVNQATEVERLAALSNTGTTEFQRYAAGAAKFGVEQDKLGDIFKDTQDKVGDFLATGGGELKQFFDEVAPLVGVTAEQFRNLSGPQALELFYNTLERANLTQAEMVFYLESVADEATLLQPLLADNARGFREAGDEAERFGAVLDEEAIAASKQLRDEMAELKLSFVGARNEMVQELIPAITELAETLHSPEVRAGLNELAGGLGQLGVVAVTTAGKLGTLIGQYRNWLSEQGFAPAGADSSVNALEQRRDKLEALLERIRNGRTVFGKETAGEITSELAKIDRLLGVQQPAQQYINLPEYLGGESPREFSMVPFSAIDYSGYQSATKPKGEDGGDTGDRPSKAPAAPAEWDIPQYERWIQLQMEDVDALQVLEGARRDASQAIVDQQAALEGFKSDMQFELRLLGLTNTEREIAINQRRAGVEAMSVEGQELAALTEQMVHAREQAELLADIKYGLADVFVGFAQGAEEGERAWDSFMDNLFKRALQFVADQAIQELFATLGSTGSGSSAGAGGQGGGVDWGGLFGSILGSFGGGRADGGDVLPGHFYRVNERMTPEMLSIGNNDYLMMGAQGGRVTPLDVGRRGGDTFNINIPVQGNVDRRTRQQIAVEARQQLETASRRNR